MASHTTVPTEGQILGGKFRVEQVLGQGGMGVVVAATHLVLNKRVALKFLLPEAAQHPEVAERFLREARAASTLHSEHIARVLDVGVLDDGSPYMVMEHLTGHDVERELQRRGRLPVGEAVGHLLQACEAIAEAHAAGVVHRDLKPANLFLAEQPDGSIMVKVLDFGIAKALAAVGKNLTQTTSMIGSPVYMAPEQMTNPRGVDTRVDVWALGVTLYEMLTGACPFEGDSLPMLSTAILTRAPISLRLRRPELPAALEAVIERCLQRDPDRRLATVADLAYELSPFAPTAEAQLSIERIGRLLRRTNNSRRGSLADLTTGARPGHPTGGRTGQAWSATGPSGVTGSAAPVRPGLIAAAVALALVLPGLGWVAARSSESGAPRAAAMVAPLTALPATALPAAALPATTLPATTPATALPAVTIVAPAASATTAGLPTVTIESLPMAPVASVAKTSVGKMAFVPRGKTTQR